MLQENKMQVIKNLFLQFFFILLFGHGTHAQIYYHNFGTSTINSHPYTGASTMLDADLSGSSWTNSTGSWSSNTGSGGTGQSIVLFNGPGTTTVTLTFSVDAPYNATITSFNFWAQRSNSGPQAWQMAINGIDAGSGALATTGAAIGVTPVANAITGLTGTVTVVLTLSGATGNGNLRIDDFALFGSVDCTNSITSYTPASGPKDTEVTITGSGFSNTSSVTFDGIAATFTIVSDTQLKAMVPAGVNTGNISVTAANGCVAQAGTPFTLLESDCTSPEIYISEIFDAYNGVPGSIELYNPGPTPVNLSGYRLLRYGDIGQATPDYDMALTGTINPNSCFMVSINITEACPSVATDFPLTNGINANDEFELLKNNQLIDNVEIPFGTSTLGGRGYTMIRKPDAVAPKAAFALSDWNAYGNEFCTNLGVHTANTVSAPLPVINHPAPKTICVNSSTSFPVSIIPATGFTYQWKMLTGTGIWVNITNSATYSGATTNTLTVNNASLAMNGNQYYLEATSAGCVVRTDATQLYVVDKPAAPTVSATQPDCTTPTGSIEITTPLGSGLTYSINGVNYQAGTTFTNLAPGTTYSVTVKNNTGCVSDITTQPINAVPGAPTAPTVTAVQPTCTMATGSLTITLPTGAGYTYSIDGANYQTGTAFTNLNPGLYNITVKNEGGCVSASSQQTIDPAPVTPAVPTVMAVQPTCTTATGSITIISPTGAGLIYSIDGINYQAGTTFSSLSPGPYSITAKNTDGCVSGAVPQTINAAPSTPATPVFSATQPTCTTGTGSITITSPTGTGLTYSIDGVNYQASTAFNNLAPGPYSITVKNAAGCVSPATSQTIDPQPTTPATPVVSVTQPTCATSTGSITITSPTGTGLTYSVDGVNYQSATTFSSLAAGPYSVTVKNSDGCTSPVVSQTINAAPSTPVAAVISATQPTCSTATGSITITAPLGTGLTYSIDGVNYQTGTTFGSLNPGPYNITVKNAAGCESSATSQTINPQPATPTTPVVTATQPSCTSATGTITVTSPAGNGLTYSIDGINYQTSAVFASVTPGPYTITVRNSGCTSAATSQTINPAPAVPVAPSVTVKHPGCNGTTGSITVTAPTGTGLTYSIDGTNYHAGTFFGNLVPGPYSVTVKNNAGCTSAAANYTVNPTPATPAAPTLTVTQPSCTLPSGTISVSAPAGTGLTYSRDGINYQSSATFSGLSAGQYSVTVKNAAGCVSVPTVQTIDPAPPVPAQPTVSAVQPTCTTTTGTITVTSPVGAGLTYSMDGVNYQTGTTFNNLTPGTYTVTVKNPSGCVSAPRTQTINPVPTAPGMPVLAVYQPGCNATNGSITVTSPTGNGFTYSIDGTTFQASPAFANLSPNTYSIIVKNAAGCLSAPATGTVNPAPAIPGAPVITITQPGCGDTTGSITVTSPTGTGLEYSINSLPYQAAVTFNGLVPGNYVIRTRNAGGCVSDYTHFIINNPPLTPAVPAVTLVQPDCNTATGTITVNSPVGFGLQYSIDGTNFQPSRIFAGVVPDTYSVTVRNSAGCAATLTGVIITPPPAPAPDPGIITGDNATCEGGTIQLSNTVTNGVWGSSNTAIATVDSDGLVTTLLPGTVTITYTTGTDCTAEASKIITVNALPQPDLRDMFLCVDNETGDITPVSLDSRINGPDYTFDWTLNGTVLTETTSSITIDEPGDYSIKVTNTATGCEATSTATVGTSSLALAYADATIDFHNNQTITVHITGGSGDYEYSIDGGDYQDEPYFTNIYEGEYHISVKDKHGCGTLELEVYALNFPRFFSPNGDGARDTWNIKGLGLQPDAKIFIFDRYGKVIALVKPGGQGWDGTYNGERLPATDYWFTLEYRSESGAQKEFKAHFSLLR